MKAADKNWDSESRLVYALKESVEHWKEAAEFNRKKIESLQDEVYYLKKAKRLANARADAAEARLREIGGVIE